MDDILREIEKGHEAKFKLDEETRFKIACRREKRLGLWAAEQMGLGPAEADAYARGLVKAALAKGAGDRNLRTVVDDLTRHGISFGYDELVRVRERCQSEAEAEVRDLYPEPLDGDHNQVGG